jgi:hypothetical protein
MKILNRTRTHSQRLGFRLPTVPPYARANPFRRDRRGQAWPTSPYARTNPFRRPDVTNHPRTHGRTVSWTHSVPSNRPTAPVRTGKPHCWSWRASNITNHPRTGHGEHPTVPVRTGKPSRPISNRPCTHGRANPTVPRTHGQTVTRRAGGARRTQLSPCTHGITATPEAESQPFPYVNHHCPYSSCLIRPHCGLSVCTGCSPSRENFPPSTGSLTGESPPEA